MTTTPLTRFVLPPIKESTNSFQVTHVNRCSTIRRTKMLAAKRDDIDMELQHKQIQIERATRKQILLEEEKSQSSRVPSLELHHLRLLIISAVQRQREHNSVSLSLSIKKATLKTMQEGRFSSDQEKEARAIVEAGSSLDLAYVQKNLLLDMELVYTHYGYSCALQCFQRLHPFKIMVDGAESDDASIL